MIYINRDGYEDSDETFFQSGQKQETDCNEDKRCGGYDNDSSATVFQSKQREESDCDDDKIYSGYDTMRNIINAKKKKRINGTRQ